jgi:hypothetical protein
VVGMGPGSQDAAECDGFEEVGGMGLCNHEGVRWWHSLPKIKSLQLDFGVEVANSSGHGSRAWVYSQVQQLWGGRWHGYG